MPPKSVLEIRALRTAGRPWRPWVVVAAAALAVAVGWTATPHGSGRPAARAVPVTPATSAGESPGVATRRSTLVRHYEYVFPDGGFYVYDIDRGHRLVQHVSLPQLHGIRGVGVSLQKHRLYISYGGDGGENGNGSLLAYDLQSGEVLWQRAYNTGIDSFAVSRDGGRIYMPTGELSRGDSWLELSASDGRVLAALKGGVGPHNTVAGLGGRYLYLGGRNQNELLVDSAATGEVIRKVGPLRSGVRPFTINGRETLAFTTATGFLGFQVSDLRTGHVLYTVEPSGFTWDPSTFAPSAPSHGISLSPDERELWLLDTPNGYLHVFDVSGLPGSPPRQIADVKLPHPLAGNESPCLYDCLRDGWLQHSRNGRYVYVGDSGDVVSTRTRRIVRYLEPLHQSRKMLEIDWRHGLPVATTTRSGLGYAR